MITSHESIPRDSLPSVHVLAWLSVLALLVIAVLVVTVVLPAETGRDPTGVGQRLGLTEMGRIKVALANGAVANGTVADGAAAVQTARTKRVAIGAAGSRWRDSMVITLPPTEGIEVKMSMRTAQTALYAWTTSGGEVFFNMHGEPPDPPKDYAAHRYGKGTSAGESGELVAAFDGVHGWFWRNRSDRSVTITLRTGGEYLVLREMP
jgi:hypothetical protein